MIWSIFDINTMSENEYQRWYRWMSPQRKARVNRLFRERDQKCAVASDMLARQLIAEWFHLKPEEIKFSVDEHGKPHAPDLPIHFSISHSQNYVFCAVSDQPIGVDIEAIRPIDVKVISRFCTDEELQYLNEDPQSRFFELWTAKEACAKLSGIGLAAINDYHFPEIKERIHTVQTKDYFLTIAI